MAAVAAVAAVALVALMALVALVALVAVVEIVGSMSLPVAVIVAGLRGGAGFSMVPCSDSSVKRSSVDFPESSETYPLQLS